MLSRHIISKNHWFQYVHGCYRLVADIASVCFRLFVCFFAAFKFFVLPWEFLVSVICFSGFTFSCFFLSCFCIFDFFFRFWFYFVLVFTFLIFTQSLHIYLFLHNELNVFLCVFFIFGTKSCFIIWWQTYRLMAGSSSHFTGSSNFKIIVIIWT